MSKFYRHVTQAAETNHPNFRALSDAPVMHRGVSRDAGTEQRRDCGEFQVRWDSQNEMFIDDDAFGVAAVGNPSEMLIRRIEREDHIRTELFKASLALWAGAVRIDHAAHRHEVALFVLRNSRADLGDTPDDPVPGDDRRIRSHQLAP